MNLERDLVCIRANPWKLSYNSYMAIKQKIWLCHYGGLCSFANDLHSHQNTEILHLFFYSHILQCCNLQEK